MGKLNGQVAIVTGSSKGIGKGIALTLAREGANIVINYKSDKEGGDKVLRELSELGVKAIAVAADVGVYNEAQKLATAALETFGRIDILVNNAGITRDKSFKNLTEQMWREVISANLDSVFNCTHYVLPTMLAQKSGRIISISSIIGQEGGFGQTNYSASKAGIIGFSHSLALEVAKHGITVNVVCPGFIETEMVAAVPEEKLDAIRAKIPMGRLGTSEEVARAVLFLIADGDYITGQEINVNGGMHMG